MTTSLECLKLQRKAILLQIEEIKSRTLIQSEEFLRSEPLEVRTPFGRGSATLSELLIWASSHGHKPEDVTVEACAEHSYEDTFESLDLVVYRPRTEEEIQRDLKGAGYYSDPQGLRGQLDEINELIMQQLDIQD